MDELIESGHDAHDSMVKIKYPIQDEIHGTNQAIRICNTEKTGE